MADNVAYMEEIKRLATVDEAAEYAGVTVRTVQRWMASRHVTPYRYGVGARRVKVDLDQIDDLQRPVAS